MIDPTLPRGPVIVGKVVELLEDERKEIGEHADAMYRLARMQRAGWFAAFVRHQTALNRLLQTAISRSHAS